MVICVLSLIVKICMFKNMLRQNNTSCVFGTQIKIIYLRHTNLTEP